MACPSQRRRRAAAIALIICLTTWMNTPKKSPGERVAHGAGTRLAGVAVISKTQKPVFERYRPSEHFLCQKTTTGGDENSFQVSAPHLIHAPSKYSSSKGLATLGQAVAKESKNSSVRWHAVNTAGNFPSFRYIRRERREEEHEE